MLLISLLLIPLIGIFLVFTINYFSNNISRSNILIKRMALSTSIINLILSLIVFILFNFSSNQCQFVQEYHAISSFDFYLGVRGIYIYFVLLTTIIMPISLLSNWSFISENISLMSFYHLIISKTISICISISTSISLFLNSIISKFISIFIGIKTNYSAFVCCVSKLWSFYYEKLNSYILYRFELKGKYNDMSLNLILKDLYDNKYHVTFFIIILFFPRLFFLDLLNKLNLEYNNLFIMFIIICIYFVLYGFVFGFLNKKVIVQSSVIRLIIFLLNLSIIYLFSIDINFNENSFIVLLWKLDITCWMFPGKNHPGPWSFTSPYNWISNKNRINHGGPNPPGNQNNTAILGHNPVNSNSSDNHSRSNDSDTESLYEENQYGPSHEKIDTTNYNTLILSIHNMCPFHPKFKNGGNITMGDLGIKRNTIESNMLIRASRIYVHNDAQWNAIVVYSTNKGERYLMNDVSDYNKMLNNSNLSGKGNIERARELNNLLSTMDKKN